MRGRGKKGRDTFDDGITSRLAEGRISCLVKRDERVGRGRREGGRVRWRGDWHWSNLTMMNESAVIISSHLTIWRNCRHFVGLYVTGLAS